MKSLVKIVECPRDAWQGLHGQIAPESKAAYLRKLIEAGFKHLDAVSFVSPGAVPQMADSEEVLRLLKPSADAEVIGIVVNAKGAERAVATSAVRTLGFPYSVSAEFLKRNQHQTPQESLTVLRTISALAKNAGLGVVAYVSMGFGNPYGENWSPVHVATACEQIVDEGVKEISLADTVGMATPESIAQVVELVIGANPGIEVGVHLHARREDAAAKVRAAYHTGCRRFDAAIGGLGGCPFAQDQLVGNIPTEILLGELKELGAELPKLNRLDELIAMSAEYAARYGETVTGSIAAE